MENIYVFVLIGLLYVIAASPSALVALWHFRLFTIARLLHTVVYVSGMKQQPLRGIAFGVNWLVNASMIVQLLLR